MALVKTVRAQPRVPKYPAVQKAFTGASPSMRRSTTIAHPAPSAMSALTMEELAQTAKARIPRGAIVAVIGSVLVTASQPLPRRQARHDDLDIEISFDPERPPPGYPGTPRRMPEWPSCRHFATVSSSLKEDNLQPLVLVPDHDEQ